MKSSRTTWLLALCLVPSAVACEFQAISPSLEGRLLLETSESLVKAVRSEGDPSRGALLFFRPEMNCAKCHNGNDKTSPLGPDLSRLGSKTSPNELIEGILTPSKTIVKGYESVTVAMKEGKIVSGLIFKEEPHTLILRDAAQEGRTVRIPKSEIEERKNGGPSLMPAGLVNLLATRQDFLDLAGYVIEIVEKGPARALALQPPAALLVPAPLPKYEANLDHAGLIGSLDASSFARGEAIYARVCANCHGTKDQPGSLPSSPRFASGTFKNGSDPHRMYQTLTRGYGMMAAQPWMVPQQKYDVIHYIREAYLRPFNPTRFVAIDRGYLNGLPKGTELGPTPSAIDPWVVMDFGTTLMATIEVGEGRENFAYKGIAVRLDPGPGGITRGSRWVVYDHDTMRIAGGWTGRGFINWEGINFNGQHGIHPRTVGRVAFDGPPGPAWADPESGRFDDPRLPGRDGRRYGPLPRTHAHYRGTYNHGDRVVISYTIGDAAILDSPGTETIGSNEGDDAPGNVIFTRTLEIGRSSRDLALRVAPLKTSVAVVGDDSNALVKEQGFWVLRVKASSTSTTLKLLISEASSTALDAHAKTSNPPESLDARTRGGPRRWPEVLKTHAIIGPSEGPFAVDVLTHPENNPWYSLTRFTGLDFLDGGKQLVTCTWDGDVWLVDGIDDLAGELSWRRIAAGLFQPLGIKVVNGVIHVLCRDQIAILRDLNGDGETDFYESFNSDHQVTEHFHEFAMDLQTDTEGNFYYAKAARHGKTAVVPQHGTLLKVSKDGGTTEILATGFRAPNGVCVNADGTFFLTDQEGFWHPKNRINLVKKEGFYGNMWGYHDVTDTSDSAMEQPLCWITNAFDRSPGEVIQVTSDAWGPLKGSFLNLSYGMGKVFIIPYETVNGQAQGGMCELPDADFPTGVMRGRFHPSNGQLYLCGMFSWAGNKEQAGGFYRLRATGKPVHVPLGLHAKNKGMSITFSAPLDRSTATDPSNYSVATWSLKRSERYGSRHLNTQTSAITAATLSDDGRTVFLEIADMQPTWCMEIAYTIKGSGGEPVSGKIDNTVHQLGP